MTTERDKEIGLAVARLRGTRSQQHVADRMRDRGFRWSQATVWNVERGERPLRLTEAEALAKELACPLSALLGLDASRDDVMVIPVHDLDDFLGAVEGILRQHEEFRNLLRGYRAPAPRASTGGEAGDGQHSEAT